MKKTETLWSVGLINNFTHARLRLLVWAETPEEAVAKLTGTLIGDGCNYTYTNTKPEYDISGEGPHNKHLTRVVDR